MGEPMRIRAQTKDGVTEVRVLMAHPMESGQRKDASGEIVPAHFIRTVTATIGSRVVLEAQWGPAISQNPFLQFRLRGANPGETIRIAWRDDRGDSREDEATIT